MGKLTDDHIASIEGRRDQLAGKIQEAYGIAEDEADKQSVNLKVSWEIKVRTVYFIF
jgi:uncharacterized protein YjbJ (UPF0337 family)